MAMCLLCRRNMLIGEHYRLWAHPRGEGERPVCRLCEEEAEQSGWVRLDRPVQHETGSLVWHARKVA